MRLKNTFAKLSGVASGLLLSGLLALNGVEARLVSDDNGTSVDVPEHISRIVVTNILPLASAVRTTVILLVSKYLANSSAMSSSRRVSTRWLRKPSTLTMLPGRTLPSRRMRS